MTPKQKAIELVDKYYQLFPLKMDVRTFKGEISWQYDNWEQAKKSALIAVDEILNNDGFTKFDIYLTEFWQEVKKEIEKL